MNGIGISNKPLVYSKWLMQQLKREDPVGDLARDAYRDRDWPHGNNQDLATYLNYLSSLSVGVHCLTAMRQSWYEWKARNLTHTEQVFYALFWQKSIKNQTTHEAPIEIAIVWQPEDIARVTGIGSFYLEDAKPILLKERLLSELPSHVFVGGFVDYGHGTSWNRPFLLFTPDDYEYWKATFRTPFTSPSARQNSRQSESGFVYILHAEGSDLYKIGRAKNVKTRMKQLSTGTPYPLKLIKAIPSDDYEKLETDLHCLFDSRRIHNEWYRLNDFDLANLMALD